MEFNDFREVHTGMLKFDCTLHIEYLFRRSSVKIEWLKGIINGHLQILKTISGKNER